MKKTHTTGKWYNMGRVICTYRVLILMPNSCLYNGQAIYVVHPLPQFESNFSPGYIRRCGCGYGSDWMSVCGLWERLRYVYTLYVIISTNNKHQWNAHGYRNHQFPTSYRNTRPRSNCIWSIIAEKFDSWSN